MGENGERRNLKETHVLIWLVAGIFSLGALQFSRMGINIYKEVILLEFMFLVVMFLYIGKLRKHEKHGGNGREKGGEQ